MRFCTEFFWYRFLVTNMLYFRAGYGTGFCRQMWCPITLISLFLVSHFNFFLFISCGRLSWLLVSFKLHVKYTIVSYVIGITSVTTGSVHVPRHVTSSIKLSLLVWQHKQQYCTSRKLSSRYSRTSSLKSEMRWNGDFIDHWL